MSAARYLFFSPYHGIWQHAMHEHAVVRALMQEGQEITMLVCDGILGSYCAVMEANGFKSDQSPGKERACVDCRRKRNRLVGHSGVRSLRIEDFVTEADRAEVEKALRGLSRKGILDFHFRGFPAGHSALFDTLIRFKKIDLHLSDEEWGHYLTQVRNGILSWIAVTRLLKQESFDAIFLYNTHMAVNQCAAVAARAAGLTVWNMHSGLALSSRFRRMMIGLESNKVIRLRYKELWPALKDFPVTPKQIENSTREVLGVIRSASVFGYSPNTAPGMSVDLRKRYGLRPEQKLLCMTMSSYDEMFSSELLGFTKFGARQVFPSQIEWLEFMVDFLRKRPDLFLLIRVHPREFPNKRESVLSYHAKLLQERLRDLPPNVVVNWPTDGISIYDVAKSADVFLNAWSSAGVDMSLLGIPVVTYSREIIFYPDSLNFSAGDRAGYAEAIDSALTAGFSEERIRMTMRWLCYLWEMAPFSSDREPLSYRVRNSTAFRWLGKVLRKLGFSLEEALDLWQAPRLLSGDRAYLLSMLEEKSVTKVDLLREEGKGLAERSAEEGRAMRVASEQIYAAMYGADFQPEAYTHGDFLRRAFSPER